MPAAGGGSQRVHTSTRLHLLCFSCSFFLLALILARKNSYRPFCSQPSLVGGKAQPRVTAQQTHTPSSRSRARVCVCVPVPRAIVGWRAVEGFHSSQQPITGRHGGGQPYVFRVQRFVLAVLQLATKNTVVKIS